MKWRSRGWVVLLRARYLRSLEEKRKGSWWLWPLGRHTSKRKPFSLHYTMGTGADIRYARDVEIAEVAASDWEFAGAVANLIEIGEEGVFRHVLLYL